jgi:flagellar hook-associated protein 2
VSTIQFGGVISGLNTQGIIDAMVAVQKQPLTVLQNKEADLTSQKAAYSQLGTALDDLQTKIKYFTVTAAGARRTAASEDNTIFTAVAATSTPVSTYEITVDRLATATRAASLTALGAAVTGNVATATTLSAANLATPVTNTAPGPTGQMAITVDGTMVQFTVGDPATTSMQSVMDGIAAAVQAQIQAQGDTASVSASIVNGRLQLAVTGNGAAHTIGFGDAGDTSNLATAFGLAGPVGPATQNATINGGYLDPTISSLNLPGTITAGQISAVVDGVLVHYNVGDPTTTTLNQLMTGFASAIQARLNAGGSNVGADATAAVSVSAVGNRLQIAISGAGLTHSISFGAAGDASNALGMLGIANLTATTATNPTLTGTTNLGVVRMSGPLDSAGLTGLTSTTTGVLSLNGIDIAYDTTQDSMATLVSRINTSDAGVVASIDRTNDQILINRKETGAVAMDIVDKSGTLGAALKLAPGTTNSQTIGLTSQVTVDGRAVVSATNAVTTAIDGVTITLGKQSPLGAPSTLTVGVDQDSITTALNAFITSFNALGDLLDTQTATTPGTAGGTKGTAGPLSSDPTARSIFLQLRETLFGTSGTGSINSLGAIGLNTGALGSQAGTTDRIQLDATKLAAALSTDANRVASMLDSSTGPMAAVLTQLQSYEDPSNTNSYVQAHSAGLTSEISELQREEIDRQAMIDNYQAMIEAQYASMESTLALLQSQSSQLSAQLGQTSTSSGSGLANQSSSSS